ncbi:Vacuolar fusion protein mon1 [Serendipita sp. 401]|nr:Vacuolar fusion protein mon1 [Serendipita sp. 401]
MSLLARVSARQLPRCGRLHVVTIRHFAEGKGDGNADRGEPAAAVPNTPSPFQLTPEFLKQEHASELARRIPQNQRGYTPQTLLTAFGRSCETKLPDVETLSWEELFRLNNQKLNKLGLGVQERKYLLWCLEKFRQGEDPKKFAHNPPPKKTQRGWGPPVRKKPGPKPGPSKS